MKEDILIQIANQIRERRKSKGITVQELAERASVSKGLISQIENSRAVPSLIVLIAIIKALDVDLNVFFKEIDTADSTKTILVKRRDEYYYFEKEQALGFRYHRIFTRNIEKSTVDIVLLELEPNAKRPMVETEAFEYKYMLSGEVEYQFEHENIRLSAGDSMLFDGRIPHTPKNIGAYNAVMLVIYFFEN
ncbi:transcriptional regulator [Parapedobacter pyrenivorans]|uniref:Transcriptional regulator n=1 Tax=Parapedobacter pyrenivorans TaxID=1305674 RepID=A0A917M7C3_9SPHI|nr:XRE family transcriptional regulator [Parapedobacter pyrenivorans]GGG82166.1 transcriptional regulator [Parapedobacter pyrenivorans]